jgi:hypothetical protein
MTVEALEARVVMLERELDCIYAVLADIAMVTEIVPSCASKKLADLYKMRVERKAKDA